MKLNYPTYNPIPLLSDTNVYAKFEEKLEHGNEAQNIFDIHQGP